jgi:TolB-like protein
VITLLCAMAFAQASAPAVDLRQADRTRVAVLDFVPVEVDPNVAASLTQLVAVELARRGLQTVSSRDVTTLVSLEERKQMLGAYDSKAGAQIAGLLNVRFVVAGSIGTLGTKLIVTAQLLDNLAGAAVSRATFEAPDVDALAAAAATLVPALLADSGRLQLYDQVAGARVFLDEALLGVMPLGIVPVREDGRHRLRVESAEHAPWERDIAITRGRTTRRRVDLVALKALEDSARARRTAAYATFGAAGALVVTSGLLFWGTFQSKKSYDAMDLLLVTQPQLDAAAQRTLGLYAGAFVAAGASAALIATGLYLIFVDPYRAQLDAAEKSLRIEPLLSPQGVGLGLSGRL